MNETSRPPASVELEVLAYYRRNWDRIVRCYDLDAHGYPIDPAWYRRRLYREFLDREKPKRVFDVGCGAGDTVMDVLERGQQGYGIEPVPELVEAGRDLLRRKGHDPERIRQGDLSHLAERPAELYDCVSLLSVLPAIPLDAWEAAHTNIASNIRPGGWFVAAYRNHLFDLYTFNSFTMEFYDATLWEPEACAGLRNESTLAALKSLVRHPDVPGAFHTNSPDKAFGRLQRPKSNPLMLPAYLARFGLRVERTRFCHFHCVPPLLNERIAGVQDINHRMELSLADDWRGNFMAAMVMIEARKQG